MSTDTHSTKPCTQETKLPSGNVQLEKSGPLKPEVSNWNTEAFLLETSSSKECDVPRWAVQEIKRIMEATRKDGGKITNIQLVKGNRVQVDIETESGLRVEQLSPTDTATWHVEKAMSPLFRRGPSSPLRAFLDEPLLAQ